MVFEFLPIKQVLNQLKIFFFFDGRDIINIKKSLIEFFFKQNVPFDLAMYVLLL